MAEKIVSQRVVSSRVVGSANPIASKFRNLKGSIGGVCIAPFLLIIAFGLLFYSEKFRKQSEDVEALVLETAVEVTADSGMHKLSGKATVDHPVEAYNVGSVLYYTYKEQKYEQVEKTETETITTIEYGEEVEKTIETTKLVDEWVDKETKSEWADFSLGNYKITPKGSNLELNLIKKEYRKQFSAKKDFQSLCVSYGGVWLGDYAECEGLPQSICDENNGTYNSCASSCRYAENAEMCDMNCVELCDFKSYGSYTEVSSGQSISPELGDYRIVLEYLPVDSDLIVVGEISGGGISGGETFIVSNKSEGELLSSLKTEETITNWGLKIATWFLLTLGFLMILGPILSLLDFIPIAGRAASCAGSVLAAILSLGIVVAGTLIIKFWYACLALAVLTVIGLVILLIVLITKKGGKK